MLTLTTLVIISSGKLDGTVKGTALTQATFSVTFGNIGSIFVDICLLFFAFSTIIGWHFFGEVNVKYLFGNKAVKPYAFIVLVFVVIGSLLKVGLVWDLSDMFNGLMVIPSLIDVLALSSVVLKLTKD